jgi:hypothetical protein
MTRTADGGVQATPLWAVRCGPGSNGAERCRHAEMTIGLSPNAGPASSFSHAHRPHRPQAGLPPDPGRHTPMTDTQLDQMPFGDDKTDTD